MFDTAVRWFRPRVSQCDRQTLRVDLLAGVLGALLVLPQAIVFATLERGVRPLYGHRALRHRQTCAQCTVRVFEERQRPPVLAVQPPPHS